MESIKYIKDSKNVCLVIDPKDGSYLEKDKYEKLLLIIKNIYKNLNENEEKRIIEKLLINEYGFYLDVIEKNDKILLQNIILNLNFFIKEKVIIPQILDNPPNINHRVFNFISENNQIFIKYFELCDFNNIEKALNYLEKLYL